VKKLPKLPDHYVITVDDVDLKCYFDFDPGEEQWFDARAGVGSPGYPACVELVKTEPDINLSPAGVDYVEQEIMDRIDADSRDYWEGVAESYREAKKDRA
jgi:hypothetical protein